MSADDGVAHVMAGSSHVRSIASKLRRDAAHSGRRDLPFVPLTRRRDVTASARGWLDIRGHCLAFRGHLLPGRDRRRQAANAQGRSLVARSSPPEQHHHGSARADSSGPILGLSTLSRSPPPTLTSLWPIFVFVEVTEPTGTNHCPWSRSQLLSVAAVNGRAMGFVWAAKKVERVTGIEPTLVVWDKLKECPLPRRCRCVLEGPLVADSTRWRTSASMAKSGRLGS